MRERTLIIAEAGVNHNGDLTIAKRLIDVAAEAQVDLVKFQTFKASSLVSKQAKKAAYQKANTKSVDDSQYNMLKALELSLEDHYELIQHCEARGVKFFSTAFDLEGLDFLASLGFEQYKIPSGEITNYPYLKKIASFGQPVILSTGMATMEEVKEAVAVMTDCGLNRDDITILHCNTEYPTPMKDVNLLAMLTIQEELGVKVGYSDHTLGIEVPTAAVALGATVIEKHFTINRELDGPDHAASLEPEELKAMVTAIRHIEEACAGNGKKEPSASELKNKVIARKSVHVLKAAKAGDVLREDMLIALRPGDGISPMEMPLLVGKILSKDVEAYTKLTLEDFHE